MGFITKEVERVYNQLMHTRHDPDGTIFYFSHIDFEGLNKHDYSFMSQRGHKLCGGFYYYDNPRKDRIIVFDHGLGVGHRAYFPEIERLCRGGYCVFSYDHTGCTESEGESLMGIAGSLSDLDDCIRSLKCIPELANVEISVMGHSWGAFSTLNILAYHPDVHSIVAVSGFLSTKIMLTQSFPSILAPIRKRIYDRERALNPKYMESSAVDVLAATDRPALIIHSLDDPTVRAKTNILFLRKQMCDKENIEFILQNGKRHNPTYTSDAVEYKDSFFKEHSRMKKNGLFVSEEAKLSFLESYDWRRMTEQDEQLWEHIFKFLEK